jgi:hypothetical protein
MDSGVRVPGSTASTQGDSETRAANPATSYSDSAARFVYDVSMRSIVALFIALPLLAQTPGAAITPKEKIALFNGKNLDGWYTWLQENKYQDPKHVFTVKDGAIRVLGEEWGGLEMGRP